jgi:hypothetical protein
VKRLLSFLNRVTKYWLPFLVIALFAAVFFEFSSVEKVPMESSYVAPTSTEGQPSTKRQAVSKAQSRLAAGQRYESLEELENDQRAAGFVRTGYFGKHWPAMVTEIATDKNKISFVRKNGVRHNYTKFYGYEMKMVRLSTGPDETIVVFRSQKKK